MNLLIFTCKQIDSSSKIKMLENCYVCFYKFINAIISYLLFFHNDLSKSYNNANKITDVCVMKILHCHHQLS
jgi:hypothetical protein